MNWPIDSDLTWLPAWSTATGAGRVTAGFRAAFGGAPDGVWAAPGRVNIIGEHTDYNSGLCLPIALPHQTYVALRRRPDRTISLSSAQLPNQAWSISLDQVAPGAVSGWGAYVAGVAWALGQAELVSATTGFDAHVDSCVPFGAGLSSSAALESAVAVALADLADTDLTSHDAGRAVLAAACIRAENEIAGAPTGGMDQSASLRCQAGQALELDFADSSATQVPFELATAGLAVLVIDTRARHQLVDGQYAARRQACQAACARLGLANLRQVDDLATALSVLADEPILLRRTRHIVTEIRRTADFVSMLQAGQLAETGELLDASHTSMRFDYEISAPELDLAVETARASGAIGARMTGGGFGGSAIALIRQTDTTEVATAIGKAFAKANFAKPAFALAPPSAAAGRIDELGYQVVSQPTTH